MQKRYDQPVPQLKSLSGLGATGFRFSKRPKVHGAGDLPRRFIDYLPIVSPSDWQFDARHLQLIASAFDSMRNGESDRLAMFMPPRHAKTETMTVRGPVMLLEQDPTVNILVTAHTDRLARRFSRKIREIAKTRIDIASDKAASDEWETSAGGLVLARGVGSPPHGIGFKWIFVDDPIKSREQAESDVYREKMHDWWEDICTRLEPRGKIVLTLTRWHYDDVAARAISTEPDAWTVLKLPAIAEEDDPMGREAGDALWPERYDSEALGRIKNLLTRESGAYAWESLYQQNPSPREGAFFHVSKLEIVDALPGGLQAARDWDIAATLGSGDYSASVKICGPDKNGLFYIAHAARGRWDTAERNRNIRQVAELDGREVSITVPQDPGAAGKDTAQSLVRLLAGFRVKSVRPTGAKEVRADPFSAQVNAGNVRLLRGKWNSDYIEELRQFPMGKYDDQVDASSGAFSELTSKRKIQAVLV